MHIIFIFAFYPAELGVSLLYHKGRSLPALDLSSSALRPMPWRPTGNPRAVSVWAAPQKMLPLRADGIHPEGVEVGVGV